MKINNRLAWFRKARFGMFIHWGLYSVLGRHEWVMNREQIPASEYKKLITQWKPKKNPARIWAALAKKAGMKYMVFTTKHHEGYCLWDTKQTPYNSVLTGPRRDLVREYVNACREYGLKVGLYYSLRDWRHPDAFRCAHNKKARRRFLDFTQGCVRELCTNYGKIDILWYDGMSASLPTPASLESRKMNAMVRRLQPDILINNRSLLPEDFGTPEEHIKSAEKGRMWEACMTFNGSWGYMPSAIDYRSARKVIRMLATVTAGGGNLLLNIGPKPDGTVPKESEQRLLAAGKWLKRNAEAFYGNVDRTGTRFSWTIMGDWMLKGTTAYLYCYRWVGKEIAFGGFRGRVKKISFLDTGKPVKFIQKKNHLILKNLPRACPDRIIGAVVFKIECRNKPVQIIARV